MTASVGGKKGGNGLPASNNHGSILASHTIDTLDWGKRDLSSSPPSLVEWQSEPTSSAPQTPAFFSFDLPPPSFLEVSNFKGGGEKAVKSGR